MFVNKKIATLLIAFGVSTLAQAVGGAQVVCIGEKPQISLNYSTGQESGAAGLFWVGVVSPDQKLGAFLTPKGWVPYEGGLYPIQARYDGGLPLSISLNIPLPDSSASTNQWAGYTLYAGHGIYDQDMRQMVIDRRSALQTVKPDMVAKGRWRPEFDSDDHFILTLVQMNMTRNKKYGPVLTIPSVNCSSGGGD